MYNVAHESYIDQGEGDADPQGELEEFVYTLSHNLLINFVRKDKEKGGDEVSKKRDWCPKNNR
jgi:hypothetical protein